MKRLRENLDETELQLEREKATSKMYHRRYRDTDMEFKTTQKSMVFLPDHRCSVIDLWRDLC